MSPILIIFRILFYYITFIIICFNSFSLENNSHNYSEINFNFSPYSQITEYDLSEKNNSIIEISKITKLNFFIFAFIQDAGNCNPSWDGDKNSLIQSDYILNYFKNIKDSNIQFKISLGGADGKDLSIGCKTTDDLLNSYEKILNFYHPVGLDFDLEGKFLNNKKALDKILNTLELLKNKNINLKITFTLPIMPEGFSKQEKYFIKKAKLKNINFNINILAMNYSDKLNINMFKYTVKATLNAFKFLKSIYSKKQESEIWSLIEITPMIGVNDIKTEIFTLDDAKKLNNFAINKKIGGIHYWSLERDKPCKKGKFSKNCSGIPEQKNYEFIEILSNKIKKGN